MNFFLQVAYLPSNEFDDVTKLRSQSFDLYDNMTSLPSKNYSTPCTVM